MTKSVSIIAYRKRKGEQREKRNGLQRCMRVLEGVIDILAILVVMTVLNIHILYMGKLLRM